MFSNVLVPIFSASKSGYRYVVIFIAIRGCFATIYPLPKESAVSEAFMRYYHVIKVDRGICVKVLRSDNGGEYLNATINVSLAGEDRIRVHCAVRLGTKRHGRAHVSHVDKGDSMRAKEAKINKVY